ncbi:Nn.00g003120.m01.CDS01 [Neocucurbitaria sp. VM-36]
MRYVYHVLLTLLVALVLAAPPVSDRRNNDVSPNEDSTNSVVARNNFHSLVDNITIFDVSDRYNESEKRAISAAWENFTLPWENVDVTAPQSGDNPLALDMDMWKAHIRVGGRRQHIGTLRKQRLWDAIHDCIKAICPFEVGSKRACHQNSNQEYLICYPPFNIVYSDKGKYNWRAWLEIVVEAAYYNPSYPGLPQTLWNQVAGVYKILSEEHNNCYVTDFPGSRATTMCVVPEYVLASFPQHKKIPDAVVSISLRFNGKTDAGVAPCHDGVKRKFVDFFDTNVRKDVADAVKHREDRIGAEAYCAEGEGECFKAQWNDCWNFH